MAAIGLFGVVVDEVRDAVHQSMRKALAHGPGGFGRAAPLEFLAFIFGATSGGFGNLDQTFARIRAAVQHHILDALAQFRLQVVVDAHHARVDDAHVHAGRDRVVQEHGVDRLAHRVVAPEAERDVGNAARHLGARQVLLDPARGLDEVHRVVVVLFDAGGNREDVGVEDDVFGRKVHLVHQDAVGTLADLDLALEGVGLALFVKSHHHGGRAITFDQFGLALELVHALLHADRVDDALALDAAQAGLDHAPLGAVHHDRHAGDVGLAGDQVQEAHHGRLAVQHGLVHVDVDDLGAVFDLLARHRQRLLELVVQDHAGEGLGAGDVGALADVDERGTRGLRFSPVFDGKDSANGDRLQAGQFHGGHIPHCGRRGRGGRNRFWHASHLGKG
jgi:hypothetical protein